MATRCAKCRKLITGPPKLTCKHCDQHYHLDCTTVSESRFLNTLTGARRGKWKCEKCYAQDLETENSEHRDNNTHRLTPEVINVSVNNSFASLPVESDDEEEWQDSITEEKTNISELNQSCPEIRTLSCRIELENLKDKLVELELKLQGADQEIENLLSENYALKDTLDKKESKIKHLQSLLKQTPIGTPNSARKSSKNITLRKNHVEHIKKTLQLGLRINKPDNDVERNNINNKQYIQPPKLPEIQQEQQKPAASSFEIKRKKKLCIISTNRKNKILDFAVNNFQDKEICHYLTTEVGILQLLNGLEHKIKNFTLDDYCVIFIGQTDFHETKQYCEIVERMRNILQKIHHTNIILCLPTFRFGNNVLMNHRIELFNNLLYFDNCTHKYAYIFDSNTCICSNLKYIKSMFDPTTGQINKYGVQTIHNYLYEYITMWKSDPEPEKINKEGEEFFRQ